MMDKKLTCWTNIIFLMLEELAYIAPNYYQFLTGGDET